MSDFGTNTSQMNVTNILPENALCFLFHEPKRWTHSQADASKTIRVSGLVPSSVVTRNSQNQTCSWRNVTGRREGGGLVKTFGHFRGSIYFLFQAVGKNFCRRPTRGRTGSCFSFFGLLEGFDEPRGGLGNGEAELRGSPSTIKWNLFLAVFSSFTFTASCTHNS